MQSNICLYIIIASVLTGIGTSYMTYENLGLARRADEKNVALTRKVEKVKNDYLKEKDKFEKLSVQRRTLMVEARKQARLVQKLEDEKNRKTELASIYTYNIKRQGVKYDIYDRAVVEIQDELQEDIANVERSINELNENFEQEKTRLLHREKEVLLENEKKQKGATKKLSSVETKLEQLKQKIRLENLLDPIRLDEPPPQGKVLAYYSDKKKVVINLGSSAGIKKNFKFKIFNISIDGDRVYKGFMLIKDVKEMTSVGDLISHYKDTSLPVKDDYVGSLSYSQGGRTYYLGGEFRSKYNKDQLKEMISYNGNKVLDELSPKVDLYIQGEFAQRELLDVTPLGIRVIDEKVFTEYVGD